jgi:hypothetical protein
MLASTPKASPLTIFSLMQRATTVSNSLRNRSLSWKRPWRFLGTSNDRERRRPAASDKTSGRSDQADLVAQPTVRANAEAVADDQHAHHQFGIDRGLSDVAIVRPQVRSQPGQADEAVDLTQQVIIGDMPLEAKA